MEENKNNSIPADHVSAMLEDINGKFDFLVEGHKILEEKFDGLSERVDGLSSKFDGLTIRVDGLTEKVDLLVEDMDYVKGKLVSMDDKLDKKAEKEVVDNHETRLGKLEKVAVAG